jgi:hypothetical protein
LNALFIASLVVRRLALRERFARPRIGAALLERLLARRATSEDDAGGSLIWRSLRRGGADMQDGSGFVAGTAVVAGMAVVAGSVMRSEVAALGGAALATAPVLRAAHVVRGVRAVGASATESPRAASVVDARAAAESRALIAPLVIEKAGTAPSAGDSAQTSSPLGVEGELIAPQAQSVVELAQMLASTATVLAHAPPGVQMTSRRAVFDLAAESPAPPGVPLISSAASPEPQPEGLGRERFTASSAATPASTARTAGFVSTARKFVVSETRSSAPAARAALLLRHPYASFAESARTSARPLGTPASPPVDTPANQHLAAVDSQRTQRPAPGRTHANDLLEQLVTDLEFAARRQGYYRWR